jgi:hypothetical protein
MARKYFTENWQVHGMADGLDVPSVTITEIDAGGNDLPTATLQLMLAADELEYDPDTQLVRVPADITDDDEPIRVVPDELAEQLGDDS